MSIRSYAHDTNNSINGMKVFDGKKLAEEILDGIKKRTASCKKMPHVAVVSVGEESANSSYIKQKKKTAEALGFGFKNYHFGPETSSAKFRQELNKITKSDLNSAVVVQMPLPENITSGVLNIIPVEKDPDLLSDKAVGLFFNCRALVEPPTPKAIMAILESGGVEIQGKKAVVFGWGRLVGRFIVPMLLGKGAVVSVIEKGSPEGRVLEISREADIIISAVGKAGLVRGDMVGEGAVVVDAGFSLVCPTSAGEGAVDGRICGDVDFESVKDKASFITPVPGGVGPVAVAMLFANIFDLYDK